MNQNFSIKFKKFDIMIIFFSFVLIVSVLCFSTLWIQPINQFSRVEVYFQGKLLEDKTIFFENIDLYLKDDEENITITLNQEEYEGLLGNMEILIHQHKGICVKNVTCPNHTCERQGWISSVNVPLVCLPNRIYILICPSYANQEIIIG